MKLIFLMITLLGICFSGDVGKGKKQYKPEKIQSTYTLTAPGLIVQFN